MMYRAVRTGAVDVICVAPKGRTEALVWWPREEESVLNLRKSIIFLILLIIVSEFLAQRCDPHTDI